MTTSPKKQYPQDWSTERKDQVCKAEGPRKAPSTLLLHTLLALQTPRPNWVAGRGDVSAAFLHAPLAKEHDSNQNDIYLWPPKELCPQQGGYGGSRKPCVDYAAHLKHGRTTRLKYCKSLVEGEKLIYTTAARDCYIMVYVDDLLVHGDKTTVDSTFGAIQKQVLLKHIGYLEPGKPQQFPGRNIGTSATTAPVGYRTPTSTT